jgi:hypothetical protein
VLRTWVPDHNEVTVFVIQYIIKQTEKPRFEFEQAYSLHEDLCALGTLKHKNCLSRLKPVFSTVKFKYEGNLTLGQ